MPRLDCHGALRAHANTTSVRNASSAFVQGGQAPIYQVSGHTTARAPLVQSGASFPPKHTADAPRHARRSPAEPEARQQRPAAAASGKVGLGRRRQHLASVEEEHQGEVQHAADQAAGAGDDGGALALGQHGRVGRRRRRRGGRLLLLLLGRGLWDEGGVWEAVLFACDNDAGVACCPSDGCVVPASQPAHIDLLCHGNHNRQSASLNTIDSPSNRNPCLRPLHRPRSHAAPTSVAALLASRSLPSARQATSRRQGRETDTTHLRVALTPAQARCLASIVPCRGSQRAERYARLLRNQNKTQSIYVYNGTGADPGLTTTSNLAGGGRTTHSPSPAAGSRIAQSGSLECQVAILIPWVVPPPVPLVLPLMTGSNSSLVESCSQGAVHA